MILLRKTYRINLHTLVFTVIAILSVYSVHGQKTDSLNNELLKKHPDTTRVRILNTLARKIANSNADSALFLIKRADSLAESCGDRYGQAISLRVKGVVFHFRSEYKQAVRYYQESLKIQEEELGDREEIASLTNNIGGALFSAKIFEDARDYFRRAYAMSEADEDYEGISRALNNIALSYQQQDSIEQALAAFEESLKIKEEKLGNPSSVSATLNNLGRLYILISDYKKAEKYLRKSIIKSKGDKNLVALLNAYNLLANTFTETRRHEEAIALRESALDIALKYDAKTRIAEIYEGIFVDNRELGRYKEALEIKQKQEKIEDELFTAKTDKNIRELKEKYESEKKEKQIEFLNREKALEQAKADRQQTIIYFGAGLVFLLFIVIVGGVFSARLLRKKNETLSLRNTEVNVQKEEIEAQRDNIESQNALLQLQKETIRKALTDVQSGIRYASRIQKSLLEDFKALNLKDYFIFYEPRDIVSGDFYYSFRFSDGSYILSAIDCTGHGVPGAFMTVLGSALLDRLIHAENNDQPAEILKKNDELIHKSLHQGVDSSSRDGMDMAIVRVFPEEQKLIFAGANNPLYLIRNGNLEVVRGSRRPVGGNFRKPDEQFSQTEISTEGVTWIYLATDGFEDQFGGPEDRKFLRKNFRNLLHQISSEEGDQQENMLSRRLNDWKGEGKATDDVTVIGVRLH